MTVGISFVVIMGLFFMGLIVIEEMAIWRRKFFAWFDGPKGLSHADKIFSVKTAGAALYSPPVEKPAPPLGGQAFRSASVPLKR
jgi:hypothetical protein